MNRVRGVEYSLSPAPSAGFPTIVFLHEGLGSAGIWRDFPEKLSAATGCGALVYSRRGYGGSDPIALPRALDYMEQEGEQALPALLRDLGIHNPFLFGHSDGASIALVSAGSGLAVRGLLLEAPHVFCEELSLQSIAKARDAYEQGDLRAKLIRWHPNNIDQAFYGWNDTWLHPDFRRWNIERYLQNIRAPMLLLQGLDDEYGTRAQLDSIARHASGPIQLELLELCGHSPHRDQPDRTLSLARSFIRSQLGA